MSLWSNDLIKKCIIGIVHRSASQRSDEFESFLSNFWVFTSEYLQSQTLPYFVIVMQEIRNGWCHITTTEKPDLKFPQLLTGSNKLAKHYCQCAELLCILPKLSTANYFCWVRPVSRVVYSPQMSCLGLCKS